MACVNRYLVRPESVRFGDVVLWPCVSPSWGSRARTRSPAAPPPVLPIRWPDLSVTTQLIQMRCSGKPAEDMLLALASRWTQSLPQTRMRPPRTVLTPACRPVTVDDRKAQAAPNTLLSSARVVSMTPWR